MLKRLAACIGEYRRDTVLTPTFVVLEGVMEVVIPLLMAGLIDNGIGPGDMRAILFWGAALVISALISLLFGGFPDTLRRAPRRALPKTCAGKCLIGCRAFPFAISTIFQPPAW
jgi:hypothetical protein